jgi:hypothetical protein
MSSAAPALDEGSTADRMSKSPSVRNEEDNSTLDELEGNFTHDELLIWIRESITKEERSKDGESCSSNGDEGEDLEDQEQALKKLDTMVHKLDSARTAIDSAQNAINNINRKFVFNIHFGRQTRQIRLPEIINFFWNNGPHTPCTVCGGRFEENGSPPIRTVSYEIPFPDLKHHHFRVHNRHLDCMQQEKVKYICISHAWHKDIAVANETGKSTADASIRVMEILVKVVDAAVASFRLEYGTVEVWHDFFSVPQWDHATKEKLLLHLPSIFASCSACLVHLDNFPLQSVKRLFLEEPSDKDFSDIMETFFKSRWFRRMWVVLEYIQCDEVHLLTSDFHVFFYESGTNGSFSELWDWFLSKKGHLNGSKLVDIYSRVHVREYRRNRPSRLTYAEAFSMVAGKQCSIHRDRFLAMCGFLHLGSHADVSSQIPDDSAGACRWVACKCLEAGDYTPLLLVPFSRSYREREIPGFSWLVGHERIIDLQGNELGPLKSAPDEKSIIRDNKVRPCMEHVGSIEDIREIVRCGNERSEEFLTVVEYIREWHGCSARSFVSAIGRIYHFGSSSNASDRSLFGSFVSENPDFERRLLTLLQNLQSLSDQELEDRLRCISHLAELLGLAFDKKALRDWNAGNTVCLVRCHHCGMSSTFRLYLYRGKPIEKQLQVYRIPGLQYGGSYQNGVGLVISDKRIVGRMMYGVPACDCKLMQIVEIE